MGRSVPAIFGLQVLTKFPQHRFTQKISIVFPGFCKLNNPFGDSLISKIAFIAKLQSCGTFPFRPSSLTNSLSNSIQSAFEKAAIVLAHIMR